MHEIMLFKGDFILGLSKVYLEIKSYQHADTLLNNSISIYRKKGNKTQEARVLFNIGILQSYLKDYDKKLSYFLKAYTILDSLNMPLGKSKVLENIAQYYFVKNNYALSKKYLDKALKIAQESNSVHHIQIVYKNYSYLFSQQHNFKKAFYYQGLYEKLQDSIVRKNQGQYGDWSYITDLGENILQSSGVSMWVDTAAKSDVTINFSGTIAADNFTKTLNFSGNGHGFNLIGNPFSSSIDFESGSWVFSNVEETVWIWDAESQAYKYRTSQGLGTMPNGIIPLAQGFFMRSQADANYVTIPADSRVHNTQTFYKKSKSIDSLFFYLMFDVHALQKSDQAFVGFKYDADTAFDNGWDASKFLSGSGNPLLFFNTNNRKLGVDILPVPELLTENIVLMSFLPVENGEDTLYMTILVDNQSINVFLYDLKTGVVQNMKLLPEYDFYSESDDDPNRFELHFINSTNCIVNIQRNDNKIKMKYKRKKGLTK